MAYVSDWTVKSAPVLRARIVRYYVPLRTFPSESVSGSDIYHDRGRRRGEAGRSGPEAERCERFVSLAIVYIKNSDS